MATERERVLLVSPVGYAAGWVPHGIGLIKAYLGKTTDLEVETLSLCIKFSEHLRAAKPGLAQYDEEMGEWGSSYHELYFAARYFGHADPEALLRGAVVDLLQGDDIFRAAPWDERSPARPAMVEFHAGRILEFCRLVEDFSHQELDRALSRAPRLIGFSVHAQQLYSAADLARRCRRACPEAAIVFGGPAVTAKSAARLLELFPEVDYLVLGDGEEATRRLASALVEGRAARGIPGVLGRGQPIAMLRPAEPPPLDSIPATDLEELRELVAARGMPLTTWFGRGCSWGRCAFCSIPAFQRKVFNRSPKRIYEDLTELSERYETRRFRFGDWEVNGDPEALAELCRLIIDGGRPLEIWAEVNARNLTSDLVALMKRAGFVSLQVGLEAFSSSLLRKMKKPASLVENVQCLRYAHEQGMLLFSNILFNFPGETSDDVAENLAMMRLLRHLLRPPVRLEIIEFLLETDADVHDALGGAEVALTAPYRFESRCLPEAQVERGPFFLKRWGRPVDPRWKEVREELTRCQEGRYYLHHRRREGELEIVDGRGDEESVVRLAGPDAAIYEALLRQRLTRQRLSQALPSLDAPALEGGLEKLRSAGLVISERSHLLPLSLPAP